jgi:hypothetical protein
MQRRLPRPHPAVEEVDLQRPQAQHRPQGRRLRVGAAQDGQDAGDELLRGEGHGEDVVHALLERLELGPQVTPPGEGDDGHPHGSGRRSVAQTDQHLPPGQVHVHHREVGLPGGEHLDGRRGGWGQAGPEPTVDVGQGELDHPGQHGLIEHQEHPRRAILRPGAEGRVAFAHERAFGPVVRCGPAVREPAGCSRPACHAGRSGALRGSAPGSGSVAATAVHFRGRSDRTVRRIRRLLLLRGGTING